MSWQVVPTMLDEMFSHPDRVKAKRATDALPKMVKLASGDLPLPGGPESRV